MSDDCNVKIQGADILLPCNFMIEDVPLRDIAHEVRGNDGRRPELSYGDIVKTFHLSEDIYTPLLHENLIARMATTEMPFVYFRDTLPEGLKRRRFLSLPDVSARARCEMQLKGYPIVEAAFDMFVWDMAAKDSTATNESNMKLWMGYLTIGYQFAPGGENTHPGILLIDELAYDVDQRRARYINTYFQSKGCADLSRNFVCAKNHGTVPQHEKSEYLSKSQCRHVNEDADCLQKQMIADLGPIERGIYDQTSIERYRENNPTVTFTSLARASALHAAIKKISQTSGLAPHAPHKILIVGPGIETINPHFGVAAPEQSYEPFVVADAAIGFIGASESQISLDLLDINHRVLGHFDSAIRAAQQGRPHQLLLAFDNSYLKERPDLFDHLSGTDVRPITQDKEAKVSKASIGPDILRRMRPLEGNIAIDRVNDAASYDIIVMLNVFIYLSPINKLLALENISRLLKPGGIFITDLRDEMLPASNVCHGLASHGLTPALTLQDSPIVVFRH